MHPPDLIQSIQAGAEWVQNNKEAAFLGLLFVAGLTLKSGEFLARRIPNRRAEPQQNSPEPLPGLPSDAALSTLELGMDVASLQMKVANNAQTSKRMVTNQHEVPGWGDQS